MPILRTFSYTCVYVRTKRPIVDSVRVATFLPRHSIPTIFRNKSPTYVARPFTYNHKNVKCITLCTVPYVLRTPLVHTVRYEMRILLTVYCKVGTYCAYLNTKAFENHNNVMKHGIKYNFLDLFFINNKIWRKMRVSCNILQKKPSCFLLEKALIMAKCTCE